MTCQVIFDFKLKKDVVETFRTYMKEILPDSRGYAGCVSIDLIQNQEDPTSFAVIEQWNSRQDYESYLQWRTETGVMEGLAGMMDAEPRIRFFNYCGI